ncbi:sodium-dependent bicarbonate transport family permease [Microbacterium sp. NPDC078428]|uniref:sodium-dependent bicarbonate transport family permease n=1 Tax=Microbacterium sp. NPDC078428 TaxID=3364190 RepID=UPI0037CBFE52
MLHQSRWGTLLFDAALTNLLSPPVLAFGLGVLAAAMKSDLKVPDAMMRALSIYLLLAIGLKGGVALRGETAAAVLGPVALSLALGVIIPAAAYGALRVVTRLSRVDRGAIAAHYGSTSLVTFTAALVFLDSAGIAYPGYAATLLAVLEVPGILIGILLARRHLAKTAGWSPTLHEVLTGKSVLLLVGGLAIGLIAGPAGYAPIEPVFTDAFRGLLVLFLLALGLEVGHRLGTIREGGAGLIAFALVFPPAAGALGVAAAALIGMDVGGAVVLGILCASASYIAAPAAVRLALPDANTALSLTASIGITFPLNLVIGIPALTWLAQQLAPQ